MTTSHATATGPHPPPLSDAGGWILLAALLKAAMVGLALLFLRLREATAPI